MDCPAPVPGLGSLEDYRRSGLQDEVGTLEDLRCLFRTLYPEEKKAFTKEPALGRQGTYGEITVAGVASMLRQTTEFLRLETLVQIYRQ